MVAEQQQRRLPGTVEKLKRARLIRRQKAGVLRFLGVPASDFEGRHEAPTIAAAAAPGKAPARQAHRHPPPPRSEEHTSELQSLMRISYAVFCLKKKKNK